MASKEREEASVILLLMKGAMAEMPPEQAGRIREAAASIRSTLDVFGEEGVYGLVYVMHELTAAGRLD